MKDPSVKRRKQRTREEVNERREKKPKWEETTPITSQSEKESKGKDDLDTQLCAQLAQLKSEYEDTHRKR
jgi:hypothetical protein